MATLEKAIEVAVRAHAGQVDKAGQPYVLHPFKVMLAQNDNESRMVGVLHDVVEDTPVTLEELRGMGFSEQVLGALDCLTHREGESYEAYIERLAGNALARQVKRADLLDNMDLRRLETVGEREFDRMKRYHAAWARLDGACS